MTDLQICDSLLDFLTFSCPVDVTTTITAVGTNTISVASTGGASNDAWMGGLAKISTGPSAGQAFVIVGNNGLNVTIASTFNILKNPQVGDTITLTGGPLQAARKYLLEPLSLAQDIASGINYFCVVNCVSGSLSDTGLGGGRAITKGTLASLREYAIEIEIATPNVTGMPTAADALRVTVDLPMMKEQVIVLTQWFRLQQANRIMGNGPIEYAYLLMQRTGAPMMMGCVIQFRVVATP